MQAAAALAAVVPDGSEGVIVIKGGRVAGLERVIALALADTDQEDLAHDWTRGLLDAAHQLAEGEA